jgi:hypothetical protein
MENEWFYEKKNLYQAKDISLVKMIFSIEVCLLPL